MLPIRAHTALPFHLHIAPPLTRVQVREAHLARVFDAEFRKLQQACESVEGVALDEEIVLCAVNLGVYLAVRCNDIEEPNLGSSMIAWINPAI